MDEFSSMRIIGKGSYGEVYLVRSQIDSRQYVLKRIKLHSLSEKEKRTAAQEARLLSELTHPNIVSYKDSFHFNGLLHIVMCYCEGGDLNKYLKSRNSCHLSESQIIHWFVQIALALQYLHKLNILHRDLKTQNIFLSRNIVKVGDLGIARVLESSGAMARTFIGTPYYMSPEIFQNIPYNHKSDIWALGCCVVEMATLKTAFSAKDLNSLAFKIIVGKQPSIPNNYSNQLKQLIKCLLSRDPDQRPSIHQLLKLSFIRSHINRFLQERQKSKIETSTKLASKRERNTAGKSQTIETSKQKESSIAPSRPDPIPIDSLSNSSLTTISSYQDTIHSKEEQEQSTLTSISTYSSAISTLSTRTNGTDVCSPRKTVELNSTITLHPQNLDSQPDHLEENNSEDQNDEIGNYQTTQYFECNSVDIPVNGDSLNVSTTLVQQHTADKQNILPTAFHPQLSNLPHKCHIPYKPVSSEAVESDARQRRREQKRQQNYSTALMDRYLRKSSRNVSQECDSPSNGDTSIEVDNNTRDAENISCEKLCSDLLASMDSDEERMLTLFTSTLQVTGDAQIPLLSPVAVESKDSRVENISFNDSSHLQFADLEELTASEMQCNISVIEVQCTQGLGDSLFARSKAILDKCYEDSEDLEINLRLILGRDKYDFFVTSLLKLKFYKQLYSINFSSSL